METYEKKTFLAFFVVCAFISVNMKTADFHWFSEAFTFLVDHSHLFSCFNGGQPAYEVLSIREILVGMGLIDV